MRIHLVNLDRSPDRLAEFMAANSGIADFHRVPAVDGNALDMDAVVRSGALNADMVQSYTRGALGCALSHLALWDEAARAGEAMTICEDDAIFNRDFAARAEALLSGLPAGWDIVAWGWNFDSVLVFHVLSGISPCVAIFDQNRMRANVGKFRDEAIVPQPFRLMCAMGMPCYSISCKGAATFKSFCTPIRRMSLSVTGVPRVMPNNGIDVMMNAIYQETNSFASFPPLVLTKNETEKSTVLRTA